MRSNEPSTASTIAVLQRAGPLWRAVALDRRGSKPSLRAAREFASESVDRLLDGWLDELGVQRVICVLPAGAAVCRTCTLPSLDAEQLDQALQLQAEAHLHGIAPPHRCGVAPLDDAAGETTRTGIIVAWPSAAAFETPATSRPITCTPVVAALAGLVDGDRPTHPLLWIDRRDGSVAMALSHAHGVAFRATREDSTDRLRWHASIGRALAETALSVGHTGGFTDSLVTDLRNRLAATDVDECTLIIPPEVVAQIKRRIDGTQQIDRWWSQYGVALGAAIAATNRLEPLTRLLASEPLESPSRTRTIIQTLSKPSTAVTAMIVLVLLVAFGPMAAYWLQIQVLRVRFGDLQTELTAVNEMKNELSMYRELDTKAWPMAKLLADIACNTPPGIELEHIRINQGETIAVSGFATPQPSQTATELVEQMMRNFGQTGIFSDIALNWGEGSAYGRYSFDLSANIARPHHRPAYDVTRDFALWTMQQRVDGVEPDGAETDGALLASAEPADPAEVAPTVASPSAGDPPSIPPLSRGSGASGLPDTTGMTDEEITAARRDTLPRSRTMTQPAGNGGNRESWAQNQGESARSDPSLDIPDPLTSDQINSMTKDAARLALTRVSQARQYNKQDKDLQARLRNEFDLLLARLKKAP